MIRHEFTCDRCREKTFTNFDPTLSATIGPRDWRSLEVLNGERRCGTAVSWFVHFCPACAEELKIPELKCGVEEPLAQDLLVEAIAQIVSAVVENR